MRTIKYKAGQRVMVGRSKTNGAPFGHYRVIRPLPEAAGPIRYRIKGETEQFERVVDEAELNAAD